MRILKFICLFTAILFSLTTSVHADDETKITTFFNQEPELLFIDELRNWLNIELTIASKTGLTIRESPGIITFITGDEIKYSGARDLIDVLHMLPGFGFGVDVQGIVGLGMRGNWGHEGKILLLIDGLEFNESLYSTLQFGYHFSVNQIKRIEVIRGPGAPLYGLYAELAVINIITKDAEDINGFSGNLRAGVMENTLSHQNLNFSWGKIFSNNLTSSAHVSLGKAIRSVKDYTDIQGNSYNLKNNSDLKPFYLNLALRYNKLNLRIIADLYHVTQRDGFDEALVPATGYDKKLTNDFDSYFAELNFSHRLKNRMELTSSVMYRYQQSWHNDKEDPEDTNFFDKNVQRISVNWDVNYNLNENVNFVTGFEYFADFARSSKQTPLSDLLDKKRNVIYQNSALLGQVMYKPRFMNTYLTAGARFDYHNEYGSSFVPRFALTSIVNKFHFKALLSETFRAPGIENIATNHIAVDENYIDEMIKPEKTNVMEFEFGYQVSKKVYFTLNAFKIRLKNPIIYTYDEQLDVEYYLNYKQTGTIGFEFETRNFYKWGYMTVNYSYYQAQDNKVDDYAVENDDKILLGFPTHKVTLNSHLKFFKYFSINPSLVYFTKQYGYSSDAILTEFSSITLANLYLTAEQFGNNKFDIGLGVYNILDEDFQFMQPYNGNHAPLPGPSREYLIQLTFHF